MLDVVIGRMFSLFNRRLRCSHVGSLREVCRQIECAGQNVRGFWGDPDTLVRAHPVACSVVAMYHAQRREIMRPIFSDLQVAAARGRDAVFGVLQRAASDAQHDQRGDLARLAFICGAFSAMRELGLDVDLDIHATDRFGMTAIGWSCAFGEARGVKWAIDKGISLEHANAFAWNYADLAAANKYATLASKLVRVNVAPPGQTIITEMRRYGIPLSEA